IAIPSVRRIGIFVQNPADAQFVTLSLQQSLNESGALPFASEIHRLDELRTLPAIGARLDGIMVGVGSPAIATEDISALSAYVSSGRGAGLFLLPGLDITAFNTQVASKLN